MNIESDFPTKKPGQTILIVWAVAATATALISSGVALFLFVQARPVVAQSPQTSRAPFLDLAEGAIPGNYKWISGSGNESFITLNADHTFSKGGTTNPLHQWEITRDALVIFWVRGRNRLNTIERPGVYVEMRDGVQISRMEKQE